MKTTARRDGDAYALNGSKTFITNAPFADVFLIYARVQVRLLSVLIRLPRHVTRPRPALP